MFCSASSLNKLVSRLDWEGGSKVETLAEEYSVRTWIEALHMKTHIKRSENEERRRKHV